MDFVKNTVRKIKIPVLVVSICAISISVKATIDKKWKDIVGKWQSEKPESENDDEKCFIVVEFDSQGNYKSYENCDNEEIEKGTFLVSQNMLITRDDDGDLDTAFIKIEKSKRLIITTPKTKEESVFIRQ